MSLLNMDFVVYERLASAKMRAMVTEINGHTHGGGYGVPVSLTDATGQIDGGINIIDGTITITKIKTTGTSRLHLSADGYAVYSP